MSVRLPLGLPILAGLVLIWAFTLVAADRAQAAEAHWRVARTLEGELQAVDWQGTDLQYIDLLTHAGAAVEAQPQNIQYRHWLNVYRWRSISRITDPNTGVVVMPPETLDFTHRIIDELQQARVLCPTYGQTLSVIGELEQTVFDDPNGAAYIRKGYALAPCDPIACYLAGRVDAEQHCGAAARDKFSRALELDSGLYNDIARCCLYELQDPNLALTLAHDQIGRLRSLASQLVAEDLQDTDLTKEIRNRIYLQLKVACMKEDVQPGTYAALAQLQQKYGETAAAIDNYRQALMRNYNNIYWRYRLARLLSDQGQYSDAMHEARICLRIRTDYAPAKRLIEDLSVLPQIAEAAEVDQ